MNPDSYEALAQIMSASRHLDEWTSNWLHRMRFQNFGIYDLAQMSDQEILTFNGVGPARLERLRKFFAELGIERPESPRCPWCGK
jgi:hypothetical protein